MPALAQITSSPYSKFGYGMLGDGATSAQRQMGGSGYAMRSGRQINAMNPASYAAMDSLTFLFDIGADLTLFWRKDDAGSDRNWGGGIDYVTLQAPLSRSVGVSAGLLPYSSVGYAFGSPIDNGTSSYQGIGGINQLYLGVAWMPIRGLSVGLNASYLFGCITNDVYAYSSQGQNAIFEQLMEVDDFHFRFGLLYTAPLTRRDALTVGVTYDPGKDLLGKTYILRSLQGSSAAPDTVAPGVMRLRHRFSLASSYGAGLAYDRDGGRIHAEADFTYQPWSKAKYTQIDNFASTTLADRWKVSAGVSFIPDPRGGYFKRVTYRAGAFYNRDYVTIASNHVRDYGASVGIGLPAMSSKTVVNLGLEYRNRCASPLPLLKEQYFNITLGVNFNQLWFYRNKLR